MVKPTWSMRANTPPERGLVVHWPPHSMTFAACQVGPGGMPRMRGSAADNAVSVARPVSTMPAPASSAFAIGSCPMTPTMLLQLASVEGSSARAGGRGRTCPAASASIKCSARTLL